MKRDGKSLTPEAKRYLIGRKLFENNPKYTIIDVQFGNGTLYSALCNRCYMRGPLFTCRADAAIHMEYCHTKECCDAFCKAEV